MSDFFLYACSPTNSRGLSAGVSCLLPVLSNPLEIDSGSCARGIWIEIGAPFVVAEAVVSGVVGIWFENFDRGILISCVSVLTEMGFSSSLAISLPVLPSDMGPAEGVANIPSPDDRPSLAARDSAIGSEANGVLAFEGDASVAVDLFSSRVLGI
jgi:hypothetical protein